MGDSAFVRAGRRQDEGLYSSLVRFIASIGRDLRFAQRQLRFRPTVTLVILLTLALAVGANTAIFAVVDNVLLRPLPYPNPEELVYIGVLDANVGRSVYASNREVAAWRSQTNSLSNLATYKHLKANLIGPNGAERVLCGAASSSFFSLLRARASIGRLFLPDDDRRTAVPVVILSYAFWQNHFAGNDSAIGKLLTLGGKTYTVVGVLPSTFVEPDLYSNASDIWIPLPAGEDNEDPAGRTIGRLRVGVDIAVARSELSAILHSVTSAGTKRNIAVVLPLHDEVTGGASRALSLFLAAVGLLLLIACVNIANLLIYRAATRTKEIAVRIAVGASKWRIVQQLLTETLLLAVLGGIVGLSLAMVTGRLLRMLGSPSLPTMGSFGVDWRVIGFDVALSILTSFVCGLIPAAFASELALNETLKGSELGSAGSPFWPRFRMDKVLIACEVALSTLLLLGAGLFIRSFLHLRDVDMGFQFDNILVMSIDLTESAYPAPSGQSRFFHDVVEGIRTLPGIQAVAATSCPPLGMRTVVVLTQVRSGNRSEEVQTAMSSITPDYFRTLMIPLRRGRFFTDADREGSESVAIVNESFARRYCPNESCVLGRILRNGKWAEIVGVVGDIRQRVERDPGPEVYLPYLQAGEAYMTVLVRTEEQPLRWAAAVRSHVAAVDRYQPPFDVMELEQLWMRSFGTRRSNMFLLLAFAGCGLGLTAVGIYGVVSVSANRRSREFAIRIALGARGHSIVRLAVRQGLEPTFVGLAAGIIVALWLMRLLMTFLYGVEATDWVTFVAVSLVVIGVALVASYVPARRVAKTDPIMVIRCE